MASKSLISKSNAIASCGVIRRSAAATVTDHTGKAYTSSSIITLRWYYDDGNQTFPETFYIIDPTTNPLPWDAVLRKTAESALEALVPQAHPVYSAPNREDIERKNVRRERETANQRAYEKQVQEQRDRIRNAAVAKQSGVKHG